MNEESDPDLQALIFGAPLDPQPPVWAVRLHNFSAFNHGDRILGPDPVIVVSDNYGADLGSSDYCSFTTYLDMTLGLFGADRYEHGIGHRLDTLPAARRHLVQTGRPRHNHPRAHRSGMTNH